MEGNDIGISYVARYAVKFEDLIMSEEVEDEPDRGLFKRMFKTAPRSKWVVNDKPFMSLKHMIDRLHLSVVVISYMDVDQDIIENWLARKGVHTQVMCYDDVYDWADDFKHDRELQRYYTPSEIERDILGWPRVTVVTPESQWV